MWRVGGHGESGLPIFWLPVRQLRARSGTGAGHRFRGSATVCSVCLRIIPAAFARAGPGPCLNTLTTSPSEAFPVAVTATGQFPTTTTRAIPSTIRTRSHDDHRHNVKNVPRRAVGSGIPTKAITIAGSVGQ